MKAGVCSKLSRWGSWGSGRRGISRKAVSLWESTYSTWRIGKQGERPISLTEASFEAYDSDCIIFYCLLSNSLRLFKEPPIQTASAPTDTVSVESMCSLSVVLTSHEATTFLIWSWRPHLHTIQWWHVVCRSHGFD